MILKTKNIKFCAFLRLNSIHPAEIEKFSRGKAEYIYSMSNDQWEEYKKMFNESKYIEYGHCLEAIKNLAY